MTPPPAPQTALPEAASMIHENEELQARLAEAEETLRAIREGDVDAVIVRSESGPVVYTLLSADRPYRNFVERMQEGALTLAPDGTVLFANESLISFLDLALPMIVGSNFVQFVCADDQEFFLDLLVESSHACGKGTISLCRPDRSLVPVHISLVDLSDEEQKVISVILTDLRWQKQQIAALADANEHILSAMAERERAEAMLRQAHKMEAVGQLTVGIAHDFNNLLLVIAGNLELFHRRTADSELRLRVEAGQRAVLRGTTLTKQLLAFGRRQDLHPEVACVNALLIDLEVLLQNCLGSHIRLTLQLEAEDARCMVDLPELQVALLNVASNARDAMPDGGSLTIRTENATHIVDQNGEAMPNGALGYVSIVIADTGLGMMKQVIERAFDPFFTTKDVGKGTGLGLSLVYGFMIQSGGTVTIESEVGVGTSVRLHLPRTDLIAHIAAPPAAAAPIATRARRILVVEDDKNVKELVVLVLESLGYSTVDLETGPQALLLLARDPDFDVVLSDIVMPDGMSGFELTREIRRLLPHMPIVLTSGMTGVIGDNAASFPDVPILRKPYQIQDLARAIETAFAVPVATNISPTGC